MYLIDTNVLSELIKKNPNSNFMARLRMTPSDVLFSASICIMELRYGAFKAGKSCRPLTKIEQQILPRIRS